MNMCDDEIIASSRTLPPDRRYRYTQKMQLSLQHPLFYSSSKKAEKKAMQVINAKIINTFMIAQKWSKTLHFDFLYLIFMPGTRVGNACPWFLTKREPHHRAKPNFSMWLRYIQYCGELQIQPERKECVEFKKFLYFLLQGGITVPSSAKPTFLRQYFFKFKCTIDFDIQWRLSHVAIITSKGNTRTCQKNKRGAIWFLADQQYGCHQKSRVTSQKINELTR